MLLLITILGIFTASIAGPSHAAIQEDIPAYTAIDAAVSFSIGMSLTGGITPLVLMYLIEKTENLITPAFWLQAQALLLLIVSLFKKRIFK